MPPEGVWTGERHGREGTMGKTAGRKRKGGRKEKEGRAWALDKEEGTRCKATSRHLLILTLNGTSGPAQRLRSKRSSSLAIGFSAPNAIGAPVPPRPPDRARDRDNSNASFLRLFSLRHGPRDNGSRKKMVSANGVRRCFLLPLRRTLATAWHRKQIFFFSSGLSCHTVQTDKVPHRSNPTVKGTSASRHGGSMHHCQVVYVPRIPPYRKLGLRNARFTFDAGSISQILLLWIPASWLRCTRLGHWNLGCRLKGARPFSIGKWHTALGACSPGCRSSAEPAYQPAHCRPSISSHTQRHQWSQVVVAASARRLDCCRDLT
ncbi:hypothetical protein LZ32DRAFT_197061 [Colletotrichum eremochloae]|nr:hypothetical protein LZ32DRAFT_197061 [Colletotrichum eremochloae]